MTLTILYLHPCRRERLRVAFAHVIQILGPLQAASIVNALQASYQPHNTTRTNYNFSMHALQYVVGLQGLAAISLIKEAWNEGSLGPDTHEQGGQDNQEPVATITHPSTNTTQ